MKNLFLLSLLASTVSARADFSGTYSLNPPTNGVYAFTPSENHIPFGNWFLWTDGNFTGTGTLSVDTTLAPQSVGLHADQTYSTRFCYLEQFAPANGQISFSYQVGGSNSGSFYWYYRDSKNNYFQTDVTNRVATTARASFPVYAGQRFGFGVGATGYPIPPLVFASRDATVSDFTFSTVAQPSLNANMTSTNTVLISWPSPSTGWVLQVNTDFESTNWSDVTTTPADDGTTRCVTVSATGNQFFRLRQ